VSFTKRARQNSEGVSGETMSVDILKSRAIIEAATKGPWKADRNLGCKRIKGGKSGSSKQAQYYEVACTPGLYSEAEDLAKGIQWCLQNKNAGLESRKRAVNLYDQSIVAQQHLAYYAQD
jgi:hypothetical protein